MDEQMETLIQQELDGENTKADTARLLKAMSSEHAVQERFDDYKQLASAIEKIPQAEPSADFTSSVMAALPKPHPAGLLNI